MSTNKIGKIKSPPLRTSNEFAASDRGDIGRSPSRIAPDLNKFDLIPSAGNPHPDVLRIEPGRVKAESAVVDLRLAEIYERFKKAALEDDRLHRWLKRIGWSMYFQRRIADKLAADKAIDYAQELRDLLFQTMIKRKAHQVEMQQLAKRDFAQEIRQQLETRLSEQDAQWLQLREKNRGAAEKSIQSLKIQAELREVALADWKTRNRTTKLEYYAAADWAQLLKRDLLNDADIQLALRRRLVAEMAASYLQASQLHTNNLAQARAPDGRIIGPVPKIRFSKV
jgi:hypothetical protein